MDEPNFSPRSANMGDPVVCYARPLVEFGCSAFPPGSQLGGEFTDYRKPGPFIGKGWMQIEFNRLILPIGETQVRARVISVNGFKVDREGKILGHGHPKRDAAGWLVPFLWPVKLMTLPMRGPEPALKGERVVTLRLLDDITMPCEGFEGTQLGSVWKHFGSSVPVEPYSDPQLHSFRTVEASAGNVFSSWKGKSIKVDAAASVKALSGPAASGFSLFQPERVPAP